MRDTSKTIKIIGIIMSLFSFIFKQYDLTRLLIMLLGIFLLVFAGFQRKQKKYKIVFELLIVLIIMIGIDTMLVFTNIRYPIFAIKVKSSDKIVNYNNPLYTVQECNGKKKVNFINKKNNLCELNYYIEKDINTLSSDIVNNFNKYKNKYYIINGKISLKEGSNIIKLQSYTNGDDSTNGNVVFNDNIIFEAILDDTNKMNDLKLYDNVKMIARISKISKDSEDIYTIKLKDISILNNKIYDKYDINIVENTSCEIDKTLYETVDNIKYFTSCLSKIYVMYDENNVYDLSYVLKDNKLTIDDLLKDSTENEEKKNEDETINKLYKFDKYNILVCDDNNIIIGNKKLDFNKNYCSVKEVDTNDL